MNYVFGKELILKQQITGSKGNQYFQVGLCNKGKQKCIHVHSLVAEVFLNHIPNHHEIVIDHIDNNPFNNSASNLQIITQRENLSKIVKGVSNYIGVHWNSQRNIWSANIFVDGKKKYLGVYDDEYDAHIAYQTALSNITT